jgi:hypothetical protein
VIFASFVVRSSQSLTVSVYKRSMTASLGLLGVRDLEPSLAARVPTLLDDIALELARSTPQYADFILEHRALLIRTVRSGLSELLGAMCEHVNAARQSGSARGGDGQRGPGGQGGHRGPGGPAAHSQALLEGAPIDLFEQLGRGQARSGAPLAPLLSSYQIGARLAWRHLAEVTLGAGIDGADLAGLAEAVFAFVDELCAASSRGFSIEQAELAAVRDRRRIELVELLLSDRSTSDAVSTAAAAAQWRIPSRAALIMADPDDAVALAAIGRMSSDVLAVREPRRLGAIVPEPPTQQLAWRAWIERTMRGAVAVIGPAVPIGQLPAAVPIVRTAAALRSSGVLSGDLLFAEDHLDAIVVHRDPQLLDHLRDVVLAPLDGLGASSRARLIDTLRAWLRNMGDRAAVAAELRIHPQTVRYRMGQVRALFGGSLDDPSYRARLTLVLEWGPSASSRPEPS